MKRLFTILAVLLLASCVPEYRVSVQPIQTAQAPQVDLNTSLNLQAIGATAAKARNVQQFEQLLNDPSTGLNNLDLEGTGHVNYINVTEVAGQAGVRTLRLSTSLSNGSPVQLADVTIAAQGAQAQVSVQGNQQYYPSNNYVQSQVSAGDLFLLAYLLSPHVSYYHSPYYYGHYPSYYRVYSPVSSSVYLGRTQSVTRTYKYTTVTQPTQRTTASAASAPVRTAAPAPQKSLSAPTTTQKAFTARPASKPVGGGGFGSRRK